MQINTNINRNTNLNYAQIVKRIEEGIKLRFFVLHLAADYTPEAQSQVRISRLFLYEEIRKSLWESNKASVNVVLFNRVVDDMKKVGLLGTTHSGGQFVFLTYEARKMMIEPEWEKAMQARDPIIKEATELGIDLSNVRHPNELPKLIAAKKSEVRS